MIASTGWRELPGMMLESSLERVPSPALSGAYLVYGELPFIAVHIQHSLNIYLMQQSLDLRLHG